jgi:hypothetical protein
MMRGVPCSTQRRATSGPRTRTTVVVLACHVLLLSASCNAPGRTPHARPAVSPEALAAPPHPSGIAVPERGVLVARRDGDSWRALLVARVVRAQGAVRLDDGSYIDVAAFGGVPTGGPLRHSIVLEGVSRRARYDTRDEALGDTTRPTSWADVSLETWVLPRLKTYERFADEWYVVDVTGTVHGPLTTVNELLQLVWPSPVADVDGAERFWSCRAVLVRPGDVFVRREPGGRFSALQSTGFGLADELSSAWSLHRGRPCWEERVPVAFGRECLELFATAEGAIAAVRGPDARWDAQLTVWRLPAHESPAFLVLRQEETSADE